MKRLELLDYGRFFAALIVVAFHYTFNGIANGKINSIGHFPAAIELTKYGYLGVELFFMISGYVIFFSAKNRTASQFVVSRAIRLYPSYWFAVLFTSSFAIQWGGDTLMSVYPSQILINLTMLQSFIGIGDVDGVYWTLAYEISFYAAVFVFLLFGLQKSLKSLFIAWPFLMCAALLLGLQSFPYLGGYYYYFAAGALLAIIKEDASFKPITALLIAFALCLSFSTGSAAYLTEHKGFHYSPYVIGILISVFFALFILQNTKKAQAVRLPGSRTAGALTYPVYLIHAHFGYMFINQFATNENKILVYSLAASIVIFIGYLMHKVIEERLSSLWKWLFDSTLGELVSFLQSALLGIQTAYNKSLKRAQ